MTSGQNVQLAVAFERSEKQNKQESRSDGRTEERVGDQIPDWISVRAETKTLARAPTHTRTPTGT